MTILVSGSSGLIGQCVVVHAMRAGHDIVRLVRSRNQASANGIYWNPEKGEIDTEQINGIDCVVHLAGENLASGRWTEKQKRKIRDSRVEGTALLARTLVSLKTPPKVFVMTSAVGYYGNRGDTLLHEAAPPGKGFLAEVCRDWEAAAQPLIDAGVRTVKLRPGVVLSHKGGALPKMLRPFKMGVGGKVGDGSQYMPWITLEDLIGIFLFAIDHQNLSGPVNAVAPHQITHAEFVKVLGKVLNRPSFMTVPAFAVRMALGEMSDELLKSVRVVPSVLEKYGYQFTHPELETALRAVLDARSPEYSH